MLERNELPLHSSVILGSSDQSSLSCEEVKLHPVKPIHCVLTRISIATRRIRVLEKDGVDVRMQPDSDRGRNLYPTSELSQSSLITTSPHSTPSSRPMTTLESSASPAMEDSETQTGETNIHTPLLASDAALVSTLRQGKDFMGKHILTVHGEESWLWQSRRSLQRFLTSKWGHYSVILLVSLDISGIFADFLISLHM